jgi:hypothetical protein
MDSGRTDPEQITKWIIEKGTEAVDRLGGQILGKRRYPKYLTQTAESFSKRMRGYTEYK